MGDPAKKLYATFSTDIASFLAENEIPPEELKLSEENRICFLFKPSDELFRLLDEWNRGVAVVKARSFCETQRMVKARMHRAKEGRNG